MGEDDRVEAGVQALLAPFYVNGTLAPGDKARIEAALPADARLREEIEAALAISGLIKSGGRALAADVARRPSRLSDLMTRITPREDRRPGIAWKAALAAGLAAAIVQAGCIGWGMVRDDGYEVLSGPAAPQAAADVIVRLRPDARWADVEALLAAEGMEIVGGPHDEALELALTSGGDRDETLRRLKASPLVAFAGPVS